MQSTLGIIKPDAVKKGVIGNIIQKIYDSGLKIIAMKMIHMDKSEAENFYYIHRERPFFKSLTTFMSEGSIVVMVIEGDNAINNWRTLMGATDPEQASEGTIRKIYGTNIERNAVHGSDSPESAAFEIPYFFNALELCKGTV